MNAPSPDPFLIKKSYVIKSCRLEYKTGSVPSHTMNGSGKRQGPTTV